MDNKATVQAIRDRASRAAEALTELYLCCCRPESKEVLKSLEGGFYTGRDLVRFNDNIVNHTMTGLNNLVDILDEA